MVNEVQYVSINRVLDNLKDGVLMQDLSLEQVIRYTIRFICLNGHQKLYQDKLSDVDIHQYRGALPCDCIRVTQVKDLETGLSMRSMTDNYAEGLLPKDKRKACAESKVDLVDLYIPDAKVWVEEPTFRTSGSVIFTSFSEGKVQIAYKAIPIDEDGFPLLMDDETYLDALEKFIVMNVLQQKFRVGKTTAQVYQDAKQDYYSAALLLNNHLTMPTASELETLGRIWNTMLPSRKHFDTGYKYLGEREILRRH